MFRDKIEIEYFCSEWDSIKNDLLICKEEISKTFFIISKFIYQIWGLLNTIIARAKSCFAELRKVQRELDTVKEENAELQWECKELKFKQEIQQERYEELDRENDELREDKRVQGYFREYVPRETFERIVEMGEREDYVKNIR